MTEGVAGGPPRTPLQASLLESGAAWRWWLLGYEAGCASGYTAGLNDAAGVIAEHAPYKDAGALMVASMRPLNGAIAQQARKHRTAALAPAEPTETLEDRHRRVADSWGLGEAGAA